MLHFTGTLKSIAQSFYSLVGKMLAHRILVTGVFLY